jgi:hypothetical protein
MVNACHPSYAGGVGRRIMVFDQLGTKSARSYEKKLIKAKRARGMAQVVEFLPTKHEALTSNPNIERQKEREREREREIN